MGLIEVIKSLATVLSSAINKSRKNHEKKWSRMWRIEPRATGFETRMPSLLAAPHPPPRSLSISFIFSPVPGANLRWHRLEQLWTERNWNEGVECAAQEEEDRRQPAKGNKAEAPDLEKPVKFLSTIGINWYLKGINLFWLIGEVPPLSIKRHPGLFMATIQAKKIGQLIRNTKLQSMHSCII